jgi:hypothetical protein
MSSEICANCHFSVALHRDMFGLHRYAAYGVCDNFTPTPPRKRPATTTQYDWAECEACRKPILRGQFVHAYDDVGEVHVDCARPFAVSDDPSAFILAGDPMVRLRVTLDTQPSSPIEGQSQ